MPDAAHSRSHLILRNFLFNADLPVNSLLLFFSEMVINMDLNIDINIGTSIGLGILTLTLTFIYFSLTVRPSTRKKKE